MYWNTFTLSMLLTQPKPTRKIFVGESNTAIRVKFLIKHTQCLIFINDAVGGDISHSKGTIQGGYNKSQSVLNTFAGQGPQISTFSLYILTFSIES